MMGGEDEFSAGQIYKFQQIYQRFTRMVCRNTEQFNQECSWILDELNALDFSGKIVKEEVMEETSTVTNLSTIVYMSPVTSNCQTMH